MSDVTIFFETYWGQLPAKYVAWDERSSKEIVLEPSKHSDEYSFDGSVRINDSINFREGDDKITVSGGNGDALYVEESTKLSMGEGNDILKSTQIYSERDGSIQYGIYINGSIDMGSGNDLIEGTSILINGSNALVDMGSGDDTISAAFYGGSGVYDFGEGVDNLYLKSGEYNIQATTSGIYSIKSMTDPTIGGFVKNLEYFCSPDGKKISFTEGTVEIKNNSNVKKHN